MSTKELLNVGETMFPPRAPFFSLAHRRERSAALAGPSPAPPRTVLCAGVLAVRKESLQ